MSSDGEPRPANSASEGVMQPLSAAAVRSRNTGVVENWNRLAARLEALEPDSPEAWVVVIAAFLSMFIVFGIAYSFGAFFKPIATEFGANRAATSTVFSITAFFWFILGPLTGHLSDRFGARPVIVVGALVMGLGLGLTALVDRLWLAYLTYGLGVGIGVACVYVPMLAVVGAWFVRHRSAALGVAVAGVGCGTLVTAPAAALLIERYGWRTADVILGVFGTATLLLCATATLRPRALLTNARIQIGHAVWTSEFAILYSSGAFSTVAIFIPFVFLPAFARDRGFSAVSAAWLVGLIGAASTLGRLGLGSAADKFGILRLYKGCFLVLGLSYVLWLTGHSYGQLALFALVMGTSYGGCIALCPAVVAETFGTRNLGAIIGTLYTSSALSALLGPPIEGFIIDRSGSYRWGIAYAMATGIAAYCIILRLREHKAEGV